MLKKLLDAFKITILQALAVILFGLVLILIAAPIVIILFFGLSYLWYFLICLNLSSLEWIIVSVTIIFSIGLLSNFIELTFDKK